MKVIYSMGLDRPYIKLDKNITRKDPKFAVVTADYAMLDQVFASLHPKNHNQNQQQRSHKEYLIRMNG